MSLSDRSGTMSCIASSLTSNDRMIKLCYGVTTGVTLGFEHEYQIRQTES